ATLVMPEDAAAPAGPAVSAGSTRLLPEAPSDRDTTLGRSVGEVRRRGGARGVALAAGAAVAAAAVVAVWAVRGGDAVSPAHEGATPQQVEAVLPPPARPPAVPPPSPSI